MTLSKMLQRVAGESFQSVIFVLSVTPQAEKTADVQENSMVAESLVKAPPHHSCLILPLTREDTGLSYLVF